jgi:hypothetical protein
MDAPETEEKGMTDTFTCSCCGQTYTKGWTDEEAQQEYVEAYPVEAAQGEKTVIVCELCQPIVDAAANGASPDEIGRMLKARAAQLIREMAN